MLVNFLSVIKCFIGQSWCILEGIEVILYVNYVYVLYLVGVIIVMFIFIIGVFFFLIFLSWCFIMYFFCNIYIYVLFNGKGKSVFIKEGSGFQLVSDWGKIREKFFLIREKFKNLNLNFLSFFLNNQLFLILDYIVCVGES